LYIKGKLRESACPIKTKLPTAIKKIMEVHAMFKKVLALLVIIMLVISTFSVTLVSATIVDAPDVTLTHVAGLALTTTTQTVGFTLTTASQTVNVQGNVTFSSALKSLVLSISTDAVTYKDITQATLTNISSNPYTFSIPWTVKAEDIVTVVNNVRQQTFYLKVTATTANANGRNGASGYAVIPVTVTLPASNTTPPPPPSTNKDEYPAAPAIAVKYLHDNNIKQIYKGVNLISLVAHTMQKGAKFPEYNSTGPTGQVLEKTHANYKPSVCYFLQKTITSITSTDKTVKPAVKPVDPGKSGESKGKKK
jgi:hypothetical protein